MLIVSRGRGTRADKRRGFTLVELLVVIGIIAVLIGILMPVLGRAREQGRNARCLSNLRQIGQAMNMYSVDNKGFIVPGSIQWMDSGALKGGRGEENWATMLVMLKYIPATSQLEPTADDTFAFDTNTESYGDSIFRCPSGGNLKGNVGPPSGTADHRDDPRSDTFWRRQSQTLLGPATAETKANAPIIDTWYAGNFLQPGVSDLQKATGQDAFPMRVMARNRVGTPGRMLGGPMSRVTQIKKSSDMAMLYDGLRSHNYNTYNISVRHGGKKYANFLFADWHADGVEKSALPNGMMEAESDLRSAQALKDANKTWPLWRLDQ